MHRRRNRSVLWDGRGVPVAPYSASAGWLQGSGVGDSNRACKRYVDVCTRFPLHVCRSPL